ncbi:ankyrin 2,3/unc44 [Cordyceps javanica]|uniref:Ankyrin 2,3/unc44 n=1 Tax=Cordyceps javanica TaxID=43265 RepID=A0A545UYZ9_9HYPO|nr:ankyrin 2,3/unc44 [Cordyceps javanica]
MTQDMDSLPLWRQPQRAMKRLSGIYWTTARVLEEWIKRASTRYIMLPGHGIRFGLPAPYAADRESILKQLLEAMNEEMRGSSLEAAVSHGYDDFFDILVEAGVLMDSSSLLETAFLGNTEGHVKIAKALLENHEPVIGDRALNHICQSNGPYAFEMAQICLNKGVKPIPAKSSDPLPLQAACRVGNLNLIKLLLDAGDGCKNKYTKKHYKEIREAICQSADMECYKLICQRLPLVTFNGESGADMVTAACCANDEKTVRQILTLSSSHELCPDKNDLNYALRQAWQHGNAEMMELLLNFGVDTKLTDSAGFTILNQFFWALGDEEQQLLCLELLLRYGADPMAENRAGYTALHMACFAGSVKCARLLLNKYSAKSQILDSGYFSPLLLAVMSGEPEMVKELVGQGAEITPIYGDNHTMLHEACRLPEPDDMIQYVLQLTGGSIDLRSDLHWNQPRNGWVLRNHEAPERRRLINPNSWDQWLKPSFNDREYTSLTYLLELSKLSLSSDTLEQLVKASGDDLDKLLIVACEQGHYDAVEMLIKCGANPNGGLNGVGPLCCAVTSYHLDIVKLLVARGAKIDNMIHFDSFWIEDEVKESLARHGGIRKFLLASGADLESVKIRE